MSRTPLLSGKNPLGFFLTLLAFFVCAEAAATPAAPAPIQPDLVVLTIDDEPVSANEYTLVMRGRVSEVFTYFHAKDGREDRLGYWKDDGQSESPIRKLRELTNDEFRKIKTVQALAKKKGLVRDISYAAFKEGLAKENSRRAQALAAKEVIYGPPVYQEHRYYFFQLADLRQALLERFREEPENAVSAAEIEAFYSTNQTHFAETPLTDVRDQIVRIIQKKSFEKLLAQAASEARVDIHAEAMEQLVPRHDP